MGAKLEKIVSFADMFTDAGFQKFLVQHDFSKNNDEDTELYFRYSTGGLFNKAYYVSGFCL
mgnify:CR=1 FL=1